MWNPYILNMFYVLPQATIHDLVEGCLRGTIHDHTEGDLNKT